MKQAAWFQRLASWRKAHRFGLQIAALLIGLSAPFAIFAALSAGQVILAVVFFFLLTLSMALTFWAA